MSEHGTFGWLYLIEDRHPAEVDVRKAVLRLGGSSCIGIRSGRHYDWKALGFSFRTHSPCIWNLEVPYWFLLSASPLAAVACFLVAWLAGARAISPARGGPSRPGDAGPPRQSLDPPVDRA